MNEAFIMKLDDSTDLLGKEGPVRGIERHPVTFPPFVTETVDRKNIGQRVLAAMADYKERTVLVSYDNYGLEASVNYNHGKFLSLILKGSGEEGERLSDLTALRFVPSDIPHHGKITMHVILTISDPQKFRRKHLPPHEVPNAIRKFIRLGKEPRYASQSVVCRVERLYVDGQSVDVDDILDDIGKSMTTEYSMFACYETIEKTVSEMIYGQDTYMLPLRGIVISDEYPNAPGAMVARHFLLDEYKEK